MQTIYSLNSLCVCVCDLQHGFYNCKYVSSSESQRFMVAIGCLEQLLIYLLEAAYGRG